MLKKFAGFALILFFISFAGLSNAEEQSSTGYEAVSPPQPTTNPAKVEVIEFFWYGCPHCYSFEPSLSKWLKTKPANVEFIRIPAVFSEEWGKHAKAYFTAEALGVIDAVHGDLFDGIQQAKQAGKHELETEDQLAKFFVAHGVKEADFREAYNSFMVDSKMRQAPALAAKYGITGVPAIIVNGKYRTNGTLAGSQEKMIDVINTLIKKESGGQ
ncbi:thiol:disulfide interchange protein DsbA [Methyloglobulus morosus KoM1]|uniref:Thiol:disulfide interchange protein n=1 Tax=Methyloglobulus morosus KoM1 TaxID=1116472 RepID=V5BU04_9GAMM|nr:thiol:disulfide interchange protein DsbA/DsbL [Methyloglobulus morosus]ESS69687.1 thiol:disulfide interchange protein DsbA [Methyloglobulus morosus KoM1]